MDWCLDPAIVAEEIEKSCKTTSNSLIHKETGRRVAAIMPVYTLGNIPDMDRFRSIADRYGIPLIADAACAIGATYKNMPFGGLADLRVLSFNGNKNITCGGGGAVVGNNEKLLDHVRHLTTTARVWPDYDFDEVGFNYRMTNIQAAVGCAQMERLDEFVESKRNTRNYYETNLQGLASRGISFFPATPGSSCWFSGIVMGILQTMKILRQSVQKLKIRALRPDRFGSWYIFRNHIKIPTEAIWRIQKAFGNG